jgi:S1-C subfamily serine protease
VRGRNAPENRAARLVAGGFTEGEAEWIVRRESELQMESLQARYDADRNGTQQDYFQNRQATAFALREELGDADYERYLESNGRSTRVAVSTVLESSPAQMAGLQMGDEIINYDGRRVFSMADLNRETLQGEAGRNVAVDFMREGIQMQVAIARGPVGIMGGRRYR